MDLTKTYRFYTEAERPADEKVTMGYSPDHGFCYTRYSYGAFYPEVSHYLAPVNNLLDQYAQGAVNETINDLEDQLDQVKSDTITPRDLFAAVALFGEFNSDRGLSIEKTAQFAYTIADAMMNQREGIQHG